MNEALNQEHTIRFGDNGEFVFESCVETFDGRGERVLEAALFFRDGQLLRGITVVVTNEQSLISHDLDPAEASVVELPVIDPESVLGILQLPSNELLDISRPVTDLEAA